MVFYVIFSWWNFSSNNIPLGGTLLTLIHLCSPIIYRKTQNLPLTGIVISLTGFSFQVLFSLYNGGIYSPSLIWLTVHPVILSFFGNRKLVILSIIINLLTLIALFFLTTNNMIPKNQLSEDFTTAMMISSLFFLDIIVAIYTLVFIHNSNTNQTNLEEHNYFKEKLLQIISHDIKNALSINQGYNALLKRKLEKLGLQNQEIETLFSKIENSQQVMNSICDRTMDWVNSNHEQIIFKNEKIKILDLGNYILEYFEISAFEKSIDLTVNYNGEENYYLFIDADIFKTQIINNIISNAIKFSHPKSTIEINFFVDKVNAICSFEVIVQGIGIPENQTLVEFESREIISRKGTSQEPGTGLGLYITKSILDHMGGELEIESRSIEKNPKNHGTKVHIHFPTGTNY